MLSYLLRFASSIFSRWHLPEKQTVVSTWNDGLSGKLYLAGSLITAGLSVPYLCAGLLSITMTILDDKISSLPTPTRYVCSTLTLLSSYYAYFWFFSTASFLWPITLTTYYGYYLYSSRM